MGSERAPDRPPDRPLTGQLTGVLARWNALSFALVLGAVSGGLVLAMTLLVAALGAPSRYQMLELLAQYFPGYALTPAGAAKGGLWAASLGFLLAFPSAWLYYRGVLRQIASRSREAAAGPAGPDGRGLLGRGLGGRSDPLRTTARVDVAHFAAAFGLLCGLSLFLATAWLVIKHRPGEPLGPHLALLGAYFPGYRVSLPGAVLGFLYLGGTGALGFAAVALIYNRLVSPRPQSRPQPLPRPRPEPETQPDPRTR